MRTIYKFTIPHSRNPHAMELPADAELLSFGLQHGRLCLWVALDTGAKTVPWEFRVVYTGDGLLASVGKYYGTAHLMSGEIVVHLFGKPLGG